MKTNKWNMSSNTEEAFRRYFEIGVREMKIRSARKLQSMLLGLGGILIFTPYLFPEFCLKEFPWIGGMMAVILISLGAAQFGIGMILESAIEADVVKTRATFGVSDGEKLDMLTMFRGLYELALIKRHAEGRLTHNPRSSELVFDERKAEERFSKALKLALALGANTDRETVFLCLEQHLNRWMMVRPSAN